MLTAEGPEDSRLLWVEEVNHNVTEEDLSMWAPTDDTLEVPPLRPLPADIQQIWPLKEDLDALYATHPPVVAHARNLGAVRPCPSRGADGAHESFEGSRVYLTFTEGNTCSLVCKRMRRWQTKQTEFLQGARANLVLYVQTPTTTHLRWAIQSKYYSDHTAAGGYYRFPALQLQGS